MRVLYPARKEGIKNTGPPSGRSFGSSDSSSSNADISSTGSQKKEVFTTLEAQKFLEYDLDFDDPNEWVRRNSVADCIYQAMDSSAHTIKLPNHNFYFKLNRIQYIEYNAYNTCIYNIFISTELITRSRFGIGV